MTNNSVKESAVKTCIKCNSVMQGKDISRDECFDCRNHVGTVSDLDIAICATGDSPARIQHWPKIRRLLEKRIGWTIRDNPISDEELWSDFVSSLEHDLFIPREEYLRFSYDKLIELLKTPIRVDPRKELKEIMQLYYSAEGNPASREFAVRGLISRSRFSSFKSAKSAASKLGITKKSLNLKK